jgi:hypothetical protein
MIIIRPRDVPPNDLIAAEAVLTASNVPADDAPEYDGSETYNTGDKVIVLGTVQRLFESLTDDNVDNQPEDSPDDWLDLGLINRWRMFDGGTSTITTNPETVEVTLEPDGFINAIAFFTLDASEIEIEVEQNGDVIYSESVIIPLETSAPNWYSYFFQTFGARFRDTVALNIPPVPDPKVTIKMSRPDATPGVGLILMGRQQTLGTTIYGSSVSIRDFSIKETDAFGNPRVVERTFIKRADLDVRVSTSDVARFQRILAELRAEATVYIGSANACLFCVDAIHGETIVYGYYRDFDILLQDKINSQATIEIEGL